MATTKPDTVPDTAIWNESDNEWELITKNNNVSSQKINGGLLLFVTYAVTYYDSSGQITSVNRYHPNGEESLHLTFDDAGNDTSIYYLSTEDSKENSRTGTLRVSCQPNDESASIQNGMIIMINKEDS